MWNWCVPILSARSYIHHTTTLNNRGAMRFGIDNVCSAVGIALPADVNDAMPFAKTAL